LLIPDVAIRADQGGRYVLVVDDKNVVSRRNIIPGQLSGRMRVIDKGLTQKDRVIVNGIQRARPGSKVNPTSGEEKHSKSPKDKPVKE
jgi:multidrug efflux pump subunit AcrA (membrane-fusion protein)